MVWLNSHPVQSIISPNQVGEAIMQSVSEAQKNVSSPQIKTPNENQANGAHQFLISKLSLKLSRNLIKPTEELLQIGSHKAGFRRWRPTSREYLRMRPSRMWIL